MNKLDAVFQSGKKNILNIYCTAGYPKLNSTGEVILALQEYGADMVEIGMPYSDPIADGPVMQESNMKALQNGMNMSLMFEQLGAVKERIRIPVILMGYLNPVLQFGMEKFCAAANKAGISAVIIPDLPMHEYEYQFEPFFKMHGLHFIFLVTPETEKKRINQADRLSNGFLYVVSSSSTTGEKEIIIENDFFKTISKTKLRNPILIGFGIKDKETFRNACSYATGAIIGSAYIKALNNSTDISSDTRLFLTGILN